MSRAVAEANTQSNSKLDSVDFLVCLRRARRGERPVTLTISFQFWGELASELITQVASLIAS